MWSELGNGLSGLLLLCTFLVVLTTNFAAFLALISAKRVCYMTQYFVTSLLIADSLFAMCVIPPTIVNTVYGFWPFANQSWCVLFTGSRAIFSAASTYHLAGISVYRLVSVTHPHTVRNIFTRSSLSLFILVIWITPCLFWFIPIIFGLHVIELDRVCQNRPELWQRIYIVFILVGFPFIVITMVNYIIFQKLRHRGRFPDNLRTVSYSSSAVPPSIIPSSYLPNSKLIYESTAGK